MPCLLPGRVLQTWWPKPPKPWRPSVLPSLPRSPFFVTLSYLSPTGDNVIRKQVLLLPVGS